MVLFYLTQTKPLEEGEQVMGRAVYVMEFISFVSIGMFWLIQKINQKANVKSKSKKECLFVRAFGKKFKPGRKGGLA